MDREDSSWTMHVASLVIVVSAVLVLSCGQINIQTHILTDPDERLTSPTLVGVSNYVAPVFVGLICEY